MFLVVGCWGLWHYSSRVYFVRTSAACLASSSPLLPYFFLACVACPACSYAVCAVRYGLHVVLLAAPYLDGFLCRSNACGCVCRLMSALTRRRGATVRMILPSFLVLSWCGQRYHYDWRTKWNKRKHICGNAGAFPERPCNCHALVTLQVPRGTEHRAAWRGQGLQ